MQGQRATPQGWHFLWLYFYAKKDFPHKTVKAWYNKDVEKSLQASFLLKLRFTEYKRHRRGPFRFGKSYACVIDFSTPLAVSFLYRLYYF